MSLLSPWITTYTGLVVNPLNVRPQDVRIEDIAHHLACQTRWAGATAQPISTAQHSIFVMRLCEPFGKRVALQGLMHDSPETYLGDMTKWLKDQPEMEGYRRAEGRAWDSICHKYGIEIELHSEVERADRVMASFEAEIGVSDPKEWFKRSGYSPASELDRSLIGQFWYWNWRVAKELFTREFNRLVVE